MDKQTRDLVPGDVVRLFNGVVRTIARVDDTAYVNRHDTAILRAHYIEGDTDEWSGANSAHAKAFWVVL